MSIKKRVVIVWRRNEIVQGCLVSEVIVLSHAVFNLWVVEPMRSDV
jgi:hypothetical protein